LTEQSENTSASKRQKTMAVLAAGLVLGLGATMTLAVWNDSEWVTGGADTNGDGIADTPGIGTSVFEVGQNTTSPYSAAGWVDREVAPGGALNFSIDALSLAPGGVVYAPVSLRTTDASVAAANIALSGAIPATLATPADDEDGLLFAALDLRVVVATTAEADTPAACDASAFDGDSTYIVGGAATFPALGTAGTNPVAPAPAIDLAATGDDKLDYCFEVTLPADAPDTLQGLSVAPAWQFIADSVA
jgi:predicted ribosomally synthesized peptide with SipW-like signal peptide